MFPITVYDNEQSEAAQVRHRLLTKFPRLEKQQQEAIHTFHGALQGHVELRMLQKFSSLILEITRSCSQRKIDALWILHCSRYDLPVVYSVCAVPAWVTAIFNLFNSRGGGGGSCPAIICRCACVCIDHCSHCQTTPQNILLITIIIMNVSRVFLCGVSPIYSTYICW